MADTEQPGDGEAPEAAHVGFDPVAALTDAHRLAIDTAQASFRSFARVVGDGPAGGALAAWRAANGDTDGPAAEHADDAVSFADLRRTVTRSLDLYLELAERLMDTATRSLEDTLRARGVTASGGRREEPWTPVTLRARTGETASTPVWLHNVTPEPLVDATFVPTGLTAHDGTTVPAACLAIEPAAARDVPARASVTSTLTVRVGADVGPGTYVGYLLVSPLDGVVVPVRLEVVGTEPDS